MPCNVGDIILIDDYFHGGQPVKRHSFVVLSVVGGEIGGLDYDFMCNVLSSYKSVSERLREIFGISPPENSSLKPAK